MCMKIKIFNNLFKSSIYKPKTNVPRPPITNYDPNNITQEEFKAYVHYLAKNKINRTFIEPAKFITEAERAEIKEFKDRIHYLAKNKINRTFYC